MDGRRGGRDRMGSSYAGFASNHSKPINDRDSHRSYDDRPGSPRGGGRGFFGSGGRGRGRGRFDGRGRGSLRDGVTSSSLTTTNPVHAERFEPSPTSALARRPVDRASASPDPSGYESGEIMPQRPMVHPRRSMTSTVEPQNHFETSKGGGRGGGGGGSVDGRGTRFDTRGRDGPNSGRFFPATNRQRPGGRGGDSYSSGRPGEARFQEPPRAIEISRNSDPPGPRDRPRDLITDNPRSNYPASDRGGLDRAQDAKRPRDDTGYHVDHEEKRFRVKEYGQRSGLEDGSSLGGPPLDSKFRPGENYARFDHDRGQLEPRTPLESQRRDDRRGRLGQPLASSSNSDRLDSHLQLTSGGSSRYNDANAIGIDTTETGRYNDEGSDRMGTNTRPGRYAEVDRGRLDSRATRVMTDPDRRGFDGGPGRPVDANRLQQDGGPSRYAHPERKGLDTEHGRFTPSSGISPARYHDSDRIHSDDGPGRYRDAELLHSDNGTNRFHDSDRRSDRGPGHQGGIERFPHDGGHGRYIDSDRRIAESGPGRPVDVDRFPQDAGPGRYIDSDRRLTDAGPARNYSGDRFPPDGGSSRYIDSDRRVPDSELGRHLEIDRFPQDGGPSRYNDPDRRAPDRGPGRYEVGDRRGADSGPSRYFESDHRGSMGGSGRYNESDIKRSDNAPVRYRDSDHLHPDSVPERLIDSERTRGPDSAPPRRFDVDRSHPESGPARYIDSDRSAPGGGFSDSIRTASSGPGRYSDTDRRRVDSGPGRYSDSYLLTTNQDRGQGRNKDFDRTGMDRELTVSRNKNVDRFGSDSGFHRFTSNNATRPGPDSGPGSYNDKTQAAPDTRLGRYDAPDRTELDSKQSRFTVHDTDRITPVVGASRYDDSRNHAGALHEPPGPSTRNLQRIPSSSIDDPRGGPPPFMTRRDHEIMGKISHRDDPRDSSFQNEGSQHPTARSYVPFESRYRVSRPSEDPTVQRPRPHSPMDTKGRDNPLDAPRRDNPHHDMRASIDTQRDMDTRSHSPSHDRASRPLPPPADGDQSRDFRGGLQAPVEATGKPNWEAPQFGQGNISTSGPPRRNVGRQSFEAGPRYREESRQSDMPFSDASRPLDGRGFFADRGRGRGRGGRGPYARGAGFFGQGRRRSEDEQSGIVGQGPSAFNDQESSNDPLSQQLNDGDRKPISDAVPPSSEDSMVQDVNKEVQESQAITDAILPQDMPPAEGTEAKPDNEREVIPDPIEIVIETDGEEEEQRVARPISPPPPGQPSGVVLALARLADLEAQMEYAYAKHMLLVRRQNELKFQTKVLEELPVGMDAFKEELDALKSEASLEVVQ